MGLRKGLAGSQVNTASSPEIRRPKTEDRRPKEARNPKSEDGLNLNVAIVQGCLWIRPSDFGFSSAFGLRASDFRPPSLPWAPRCLKAPLSIPAPAYPRPGARGGSHSGAFAPKS